MAVDPCAVDLWRAMIECPRRRNQMSQPAAPSILSATPTAAPTYIAVSDDLCFLDLTTVQGDELHPAPEPFPTACKCGNCIRARIDGVFPERFGGIAIVQVSPIGGYAINLAFSDGHARGIYPWAYLLDLKAPA